MALALEKYKIISDEVITTPRRPKKHFKYNHVTKNENETKNEKIIIMYIGLLDIQVNKNTTCWILHMVDTVSSDFSCFLSHFIIITMRLTVLIL